MRTATRRPRRKKSPPLHEKLARRLARAQGKLAGMRSATSATPYAIGDELAILALVPVRAGYASILYGLGADRRVYHWQHKERTWAALPMTVGAFVEYAPKKGV